MGEWKYKEDMTKKRQQRIGMIVGIVLIIFSFTLLAGRYLRSICLLW